MRTMLACLLAALAMLNAASSKADAQSTFAKMRSLVGEWRAPLIDRFGREDRHRRR